jgi:hypothetical protein
MMLIPLSGIAQDTVQTKKFTVNGYVKDLQVLTFDKNFSNLITNNLIHNRLNFKYKQVPSLTAALELRNRLYWGEEVKLTPNYSSHLRNVGESANLSHVWFETNGMFLHTNIDRFWLEYAPGKWNIRLGRQRINWGIGTTWNPNDLFNTFNFLDFDYEERPGSDAVKLQFFTGNMSHIEFAVARSGITQTKTIAATRYFMNKWQYDFQFVAGWYRDQATAGLGWSGSIGEAGFKGEMQYFIEHDSLPSRFNLVLESDYVFDNGWYASVGGLINERGLDSPISNWNISGMEFSPRNLMPTKWNVLTTVSKEITPLFTINASLIYSPKTNLLMALPSLQYNVATNLDVNLVWQSFFAESNNNFGALSHRAFLRFKWSF